MTITNRYFEGDAGAAHVCVERDVNGESVGNGHLLQTPSDPENSPPIAGWTEISLTEYNARIESDRAIAVSAKEAEQVALTQAKADAFNDLVANGVAAATATTLTGYTP